MLALQFGRPDVDTFIDELTASQYSGWRDFFDVVPISPIADLHRHAAQRAEFRTAYGAKTKPADLLPAWATPKPSPSAVWSQAKAWAAKLGLKVQKRPSV